MLNSIRVLESSTGFSSWAKCQSWIEKNAGSQYFETWFRKSDLRISDSGIAIVEVPNSFIAAFIEANFKELVIQSITACIDPKITVVRFEAVEKDWKILPPIIDSVAQKAVERFSSPKVEGVSVSERYSPPKNLPAYFNPLYTFDSFVAGDNNNFARSACLAVAERPGNTKFNPLTIFGSTGLGKTHLLHAIGNFAQSLDTAERVVYMTSQEFTKKFQANMQENKDYLSFTKQFVGVDILMIDDVQFFAKKPGTQKAFYEIFSELLSHKKQIVLTSDCQPKDIPDMMDSLISRFEGGLTFDIRPPSLETRIAILRKKSHSDGIALPDDVVQYIASAVTGNVRELEGILIRLIASASFTGKDLSIDTAREIFGVSSSESGQRITTVLIEEKTAEHFGIQAAQLKADSRRRDVTLPRNIALFLCKKHTKQSLRTIGLHFGRDYSTVIYACKKVESDMQKCPEIQKHISAIEDLLNVI